MARSTARTPAVAPTIKGIPTVTFYAEVPNTYVGVEMQNFPANASISASFSQDNPLASFQPTNQFVQFPPAPNAPQNLKFPTNFVYSGTVPSTAFLTVTVITRGEPISKTVKVNYYPKP